MKLTKALVINQHFPSLASVEELAGIPYATRVVKPQWPWRQSPVENGRCGAYIDGRLLGVEDIRSKRGENGRRVPSLDRAVVPLTSTALSVVQRRFFSLFMSQ
jgi:hypothetical protein